jgi:uncharacterized protein
MQPAASRQVFPDRLRGVALLGIVVVNVPFLAISANGFTAESVRGPLDAVTVFAVFTLAQGKFYLLFSFLFGYSAAFILRGNGPAERSRFRRRLLVLGCIGLLHAVFLFVGDILLTYALLGLGLLAVAGRSDRALRRWAIASMAAGVLVLVVMALAAVAEPQAEPASLTALNAALENGSFLEAAAARLNALPDVLITVAILQGFMAFSAFCLGLLASRSQLLAAPETRESKWKAMAIVGLGVGLPLQAAAALLQLADIGDGYITTPASVMGIALGFATAPIMAVGYLGLLGWGLSRRPRLLAISEAAGRSSLSLYIGESVLLSLLFCGYGLGLFGQLGAFQVVLSGIAAWILLEVLAKAWLGRFQQGPLEAVMGRLTGRRPASSSAGAVIPDTVH